MNLGGWCVIVPLCFASVVTGLIQALGAPWGLFRHYWIVAKLGIAILATIVLLVHMQPIGDLGRVAAAYPHRSIVRSRLAAVYRSYRCPSRVNVFMTGGLFVTRYSL